MASEAIAADSKKHPGCSYSMQTVYKSVMQEGGVMQGEQVVRAFRHCQGKEPVEVFASSSSQSGSELVIPGLPMPRGPRGRIIDRDDGEIRRI
jgi:hypothetical protein